MRLPSSRLTECRIRERSSAEIGAADIYLSTEVRRRRFAEAGEEHHRAADLHLIAAGKFLLLNPLIVDERAVGTAEVRKKKSVAVAAQLGMPARHFGVVKLDRIAGLAAKRKRHAMAIQLKAGSLVTTLNHEQRSSHGIDSNLGVRWQGPDDAQAIARGCCFSSVFVLRSLTPSH